MALRVLLDATAIPVDRGGVGRYVDGLVPALVGVDDGLDLVVVSQPHDVAGFAASGARVRTAPEAVRRRPARLAWEQTGLPLLATRLGADVLHCPHYTMPLACRVPVVVTLHDATFFTDAGLHLPVKARFFRLATRLAVRRAAGCIVPSAATRDEVRRCAGGVRRPVTVAPHGVDLATFHRPTPAERAEAAARWGVPDGGYVAFLGTIEPRKNVPALVRGWLGAFADDPHPPPLVLAGGAGWDESVDGELARVPSRLRVVRTGYLPLPELRAVLGGAAVVAYPSLGEGFGLPVLEAMACGATVLTTRRLSLPEVGGDAVAYCETGERDIAAALRELFADPARRARLAELAGRRAASFTWKVSAERHREAYQAAVSSSSPSRLRSWSRR